MTTPMLVALAILVPCAFFSYGYRLGKKFAVWVIATEVQDAAQARRLVGRVVGQPEEWCQKYIDKALK